MPLEQSVPVEPVLELQQRLPQFLDGVESPHPQQLLLQGTDELGSPPNKLDTHLDVE